MKNKNMEIVNEFVNAVIDYTIIMAQDDLNKQIGRNVDLSLPIQMGLKSVNRTKTDLVNMIEELGG